MPHSGDETRICLACNEDGFGPSAFGYYIARALIESWAAAGRKLQLIVLNRSAENFNRQIYAGRPVDVRPVDSLVRLPKLNGEVHVPQTLELLRPYAATRMPYANALRGWLDGCDIAIDIGVPLFTRAATHFGVRHRLTVFDHSWAATLRLITSDEWKHIYRANPVPGPAERAAADEIAKEIEDDEASATDVFLFEDYITPEEFVSHWKRLGLAPRVLSGVLGSRVTEDQARTKLDSTLKEYGQVPAPRNTPLVLVSPGGTPVWDDQLLRLLEEVLEAPEQRYVMVFAKDLSKVLAAASPALRYRIQVSDRIRYYGPVRGTTQQGVLPAFDRIITRAGGGTVNDALAAGVRLAFVEEPQVQIKLIERECARLGISNLPATLEDFRKSPWKCVDSLVRMPLPEPLVSPAVNAEGGIVERVVSLLN